MHDTVPSKRPRTGEFISELYEYNHYPYTFGIDDDMVKRKLLHCVLEKNLTRNKW